MDTDVQGHTQCHRLCIKFSIPIFNHLTLENVYCSNKYIKLVKQNLRMNAISNEVTVSCKVDCKVQMKSQFSVKWIVRLNTISNEVVFSCEVDCKVEYHF